MSAPALKSGCVSRRINCKSIAANDDIGGGMEFVATKQCKNNACKDIIYFYYGPKNASYI